jgi:glutamate/tyrosine decarboxylase-like PLP-dependent enzyme
MPTLLEDTARRADRYLQSLPERNVAPTPRAVVGLERLTGPLPEVGLEPAQVLAELDEFGTPAAVASAGGRYFGFVVGSALPAALAANWLAGAWNQNAAVEVMGPGARRLETTALRWTRDLLGLPETAWGAFVTGDTMANVCGLAAARHALLSRAGWDVERDGLFGAPPITVVVGDEVHISVLKALTLLGFGRDRVTRVPSDTQGRMRSDALPKLTGPTIVCAQAGNVNTGSFDPAGEICRWAHADGAWVHVDGAFGLWAAAAPARRPLVSGTEEADSWAVDGHKWLNVPYDSGMAFVRDPRHLRAALASAASAYLPQTTEGEPMEFVPEMSRRARGVDAWAALRSLGRTGIADLVERCCRHARRFSEGLSTGGATVLNDVVLNQVLVSFGSDETTRQTIAEVQREGTCWCGGTEWHGKAAMRISVSSWATTEADVDRSIAAILRVAGR